MTATIETPAQQAAKKTRAKVPSITLGQPQVNLLPPEVHAKRSLSRIKKWLAAFVVLAVLVAAGIVALAVLTQQAADQELADQQAETQRLVTEQQQYAEVPLVRDQLETIRGARELAMSTEILWADYLAAVAATTPEGVSIETIAVAVPSPMEVPVAPLDALQGASVATITFATNSRTLPDTAAWLDGLASVPGFVDAWFTSASITETEGVAYYSVSGTVQVDASAQAQRFAPTEGED